MDNGHRVIKTYSIWFSFVLHLVVISPKPADQIVEPWACNVEFWAFETWNGGVWHGWMEKCKCMYACLWFVPQAASETIIGRIQQFCHFYWIASLFFYNLGKNWCRLGFCRVCNADIDVHLSNCRIKLCDPIQWFLASQDTLEVMLFTH